MNTPMGSMCELFESMKDNINEIIDASIPNKAQNVAMKKLAKNAIDKAWNSACDILHETPKQVADTEASRRQNDETRDKELLADSLKLTKAMVGKKVKEPSIFSDPLTDAWSSASSI